MPYSTVQYTGNGTQTQFAVSFPFISRDHVSVTVDGVNKTFSWISDGLISITPAPATGKLVTVQRNSSRSLPIVDFQDATTLTEQDLDLANTQAIYISQEAFDASNVAEVTSEVTALRDAAANYAANSASSATASANSATASAASATASATSATLAATNAASAEALNRVLKTGDTMTGELVLSLPGGTSWGATRTITWHDTSGTPDYRKWTWFCWTPTANNWEGALSLAGMNDAQTDYNHIIDFYVTDGVTNRIVIPAATQLWTSYGTPTIPDDTGPDLWFRTSRFETTEVTDKLGIGVAPTADLEVNKTKVAGTTYALVKNPDNGATSYAKLQIDQGAVTTLLMSANNSAGYVGTTSAHPFYIQQGGLNRINIAAGGYVQCGLLAQDSRITVVHDRGSNPYGLIVKTATGGAQENDFFIGSTGTGTNLGNCQNLALNFFTNNTKRLTIGNDGKTTFTMPDAAIMWLFAGTTRGIRMFTNAGGSNLEGVDQTGVGSYQPLFINGSEVRIQSGAVDRVKFDASGNVIVGNAALATTATAGFPWIPSCAGAPTGAPTAPYTNAAAMVVDTTNNRLYIRVGSTWKYATLT